VSPARNQMDIDSQGSYDILARRRRYLGNLGLNSLADWQRRVNEVMADVSVLILQPSAAAAPPTSASIMAATPAPARPASFRVDTAFPAVQIGGGAGRRPAPAALTATLPTGTPDPASFVVRATVDETDLDDLDNALKSQHGEQVVFSDPRVEPAQTCGGDPPVGHDGDVRARLGADRLRELGLDGRGVAVAVMDTGINLQHLTARGRAVRLDRHLSWTPNGLPTPGAYAVGHGTMCAWDVLLAAPEATLLDFALLQSTGGITALLSDALRGYNELLGWMSLPNGERPYHSLVVSNSWAMFQDSWDPFPPGHSGRYIDNANHPFNVLVGTLSQAGADIVFCAGNCGPVCPDGRCQGDSTGTIRGANSSDDVLCVGGVDVNGALVGYSSQGPGRIGQQKPDLVTCTHFLGSESFGAGTPDSGTSAACPVAAGVVAALRSAFPFDPGNPTRSPANMRNYLRQHAVRAPGQPWAADMGFGELSSFEFDNAGQHL